MSKTLTKADVFDVASDLIEQNGSATTLEIKNELRHRGFFALQADVSQFMMDVCIEENWVFTVNGNHRVYTDNSSTNQSAPQPSSNFAALAAAAGHVGSVHINGQSQQAVSASVQVNTKGATGETHVTRSGKQITAFVDKSEAKVGDWCAYSVVSQDEYYFPSIYTRDDVRLAYRAFLNIVNISDVRACRLK